VNRLVGSRIACVQEFGRCTEQCSHVLRLAIADRCRDGFTARRRAQPGAPGLQQLRHLGVAALASNFEQVTKGEGIGAPLEEQGRHGDLVLSDGKGERRPVLVVRAHECRVFSVCR
jgi:hypothetical protein